MDHKPNMLIILISKTERESRNAFIPDKSVSAPLREQTEESRHNSAASHAPIFKQLAPTSLGCFIFDLDCRSDLGNLCLDNFRFLVPFPVVLDQDLYSFLGTIFANEPSWALGNKAMRRLLAVLS